MSFAGDIFAALLPPKCTLCGSVADGHKVIPDIVPSGANICCRCASSFVPSVPDRRWFLCLSEPYEGDPHPELKLYMPYEYDGRMASMIHKIKFGKQRELAVFAGGLLGMIMKTCLQSVFHKPQPIRKSNAKLPPFRFFLSFS